MKFVVKLGKFVTVILNLLQEVYGGKNIIFF